MPMTACSSAAHAAVVSVPGLPGSGAPGAAGRVPRPVPPLRVQFHAQPDQILQRVHVDVAGHDGRHGGVAGDSRGGVPVQPGAVVRAGLGRLRAAGGPPGPDPLRPLLLQRRVAVEQQQVGQGDVHPGFDRLPGPLRHQVRRGQPPHRLGQRVVVPLPLGPVVFLPGRGGQRVQHRRDRGGALGGQVPVHDPGAADRGGQLHLPVRELPPPVLIGQVPPGPDEHLREQARQVAPAPARRRTRPAAAHHPRPGAPGGACRSTGRSPARPTPRPVPAASAASTLRVGGGPLGPGASARRRRRG